MRETIERLRDGPDNEPSEPETYSTPPSHQARPNPVPRHPGGRDPEHDWEGAADYVDRWIEKNGRLPRKKDGSPNKMRAIEIMLEFLPRPGPDKSLIYRWFKDHPKRWQTWW